MALLEDTFWCQLFAAFGDTPILPCLESATFRTTTLYRYIDMGVFRLLNPSIRELIVVFSYAPEIDFKQLGKAITTCFSSMQSLEVLSMTVPDLRSFLDMGTLPRTHPRLRSLELHRGAPITLSSLRPLATLFNLEHLSIRLSLWNSEPPNLPVGMVLSGLRRLALSCGNCAVINAWPDLEGFYLADEACGDRYQTRAEGYANLESVVAFARHCPGLRRIQLPTVRFDPCSALANELACDTGTAAPHRLRKLSVNHVTRLKERDEARSGEDAVQFRALMEKLFPNAAIPR